MYSPYLCSHKENPKLRQNELLEFSFQTTIFSIYIISGIIAITQPLTTGNYLNLGKFAYTYLNT